MNILLAPNSFKESADSIEITQQLSLQFSDKKSYNLILKPLTDGGDGFLSVCKSLFNVKLLTLSIVNIYSNQLNNYKILYDSSNGAIYIETAELFGIKSVPEKIRKPLTLNSGILGNILLKINEDIKTRVLKVNNVYIGVGGTATIDFGIGTCSQLGLKLYDTESNVLEPIPENFIKVRSFNFSEVKLPFKINFIVDVNTPLFGEPGAIEIYGNQKGASQNDLALIKNGIVNLLELFDKNPKIKIPSILNGAGGGIASGFNIFYESEIIPAKDFIKKNILKDINPDNIDAVITGEGKYDEQSFEGKGIGVLLEMFKDMQIPIYVICGTAEFDNKISLPKNVRVIELQKFFADKNESIKNIKSGLAQASKLIKSELRH